MEKRGFCRRLFAIDLTEVESRLARRPLSILVECCDPQIGEDFWSDGIQYQLCMTTYPKGEDCGLHGFDLLEAAIEDLFYSCRSDVNKSNFYDVFEAVMADRPHVGRSEYYV